MQVAEEIISLDKLRLLTVRGDLVKAMKQLQKRKADFDMVPRRRASPTRRRWWRRSRRTRRSATTSAWRVSASSTPSIGGRIADKKADDAVNEAVCQIAADRIPLNKIDLVKPEGPGAQGDDLPINAYAELYETERSRSPSTSFSASPPSPSSA